MPTQQKAANGLRLAGALGLFLFHLTGAGAEAVALKAAPLTNGNLVLTAAGIAAGNASQPIIYYTAYDIRMILPTQRAVFPAGGGEQPLPLKLGADACKLRLEPGRDAVVVRGATTIPLEGGGLGYKPALLTAATEPAYWLAFPRAFTALGQLTVFYRSGFSWTGKAGETEFRIYDDNLDGAFEIKRDAVGLGPAGKVEVFAPLSEHLPTSNAVYKIGQLARDGTSMTLEPYAGDTGELRLTATPTNLDWQLALADAQGNCGFTTAGRGQVLRLPVGEYRLLHGSASLRGTDQIACFVLPGKEPPLKKTSPIMVAKNQATQVTLGECLPKCLPNLARKTPLLASGDLVAFRPKEINPQDFAAPADRKSPDKTRWPDTILIANFDTPYPVDTSSFGSNRWDTGTCAWKADGADGWLEFNGGEYDYLSIPDNASLHSPNHTVSLWVRLPPATADGRYPFLYSKGWNTATNRDWGMYTVSQGGKWFAKCEYPYLKAGTQEKAEIKVGQVEITPDVWHHTVVTYDGQSLNLYLDGVLQTNATDCTGILATTPNPLLIGRRAGDHGEVGRLRGDLDNIRIYKVGLSAKEIQALYKLGRKME